MTKKKWLYAGLAVLVLALLAFGVRLGARVHQIATFFDEDRIAQNFTSMDSLFTVSEVARAAQPSALPEGEKIALPEQLHFDAARLSTEAFLDFTGTTGLLVMKGGAIVHEAYFRGHSPEKRHISWSVAKSMISAMIGIAIEAGHIGSVEDPVERYAKPLEGTAYAGVRLKDVLQMSSGVAFNEDYHADDSDIVKLASMAILGGSFNAYAKELSRDVPPGRVNRYSSYDTQVLGMVLAGAVGKSLTEYMAEVLWQPLGAEREGAWIVDSDGMEMAFGGYNATLRDYARFGQLYLQRGQWQGKQLVPEAWIDESLTMDGEHLLPSNFERETFLGYGYQWWIPEDAAREYMAVGVYNQFIYISPRDEVVIVKQSANHYYESEFDDFVTTAMHIQFFRALTEHLRAPE